ncbi:MAG: FhaA domain-containing protein [Phycicoccus sp.]
MGLFDRLEAGIERAVQGTFAKHLKSAVHPVEIASHIRRAMDDRAVTSGGRAIVPNVFTIELSSSDFDRLAPDLESIEMDLVAAAEEHCDGQRYQPAGPIDIVFEEHDDLETGVFRLRPSKASRPRATGMTGQNRALPEQGSRDRSWSAPDADPSAPSPVRPPSSGLPPAGPPPAGPASASPASSHPDGGTREPADEGGPTRAHPAPERSAPPRRPRVNPADRPWLDVDGERYPLMSALTVLGRDDSADIILDDPGISRRHSELRVTTDGPHTVATIRDLGSTNGTFVSGERITSERLEDGDRITVGRTSITYRAGRR